MYPIPSHPPHYSDSLNDPPDSITVAEFLHSERYGRHPFSSAKAPYTCGVEGTSHSAAEVVLRTDYLARAIAKRLGFNTHEGTEWERVVCIYSLNTIDYLPVTHAVHRLSGIVTPASAAYSPQELEHQLRSSGATAIFTCVPLLSNALEAAKATGIPNNRIFILPIPKTKNTLSFQSIDDLISEGKTLPPVAPLRWVKGQGKRQIAFLCYSSGTSGLPKAVMLSHHNIIASVLQLTMHESVPRNQLGIKTQVALGVLPFSHIYGLTVIALVSQFRGDEVIVLPRYDFSSVLAAVQKYRIEQLNVVPPILVQMISQQTTCLKYDLSSVRLAYCGAAPLGYETVEDLNKIYPKWRISQGYGMTEASPGVCSSDELDCLTGSSGSLIPGTKAKLIDMEGKEVTDYETRGELLIQSPSIAVGYLNNEKASAATFVWQHDGRWLMSGDEVVIRKSEKGNDHIVIVDRIKELIKVKGHQVAPAELEAHILTHPFVSDCAVIPVLDDRAGERPKAYVVKAKEASGKSDADIIAAVCKHVEDHKARHKWLNGGVEFINIIPKSPSGKILRRLLRDKERNKQKAAGAKL